MGQWKGCTLVHRQAQQVPAVPDAPDYSPTLGAIAKELRAVGKRLDGIEGHPALTLTPDAYAAQVTAGVRRVGDEAGRGLTHAQGRFSDALREMGSLIGSARNQFAQRRREWVAVATGAVAGLALWFPLVWLTPSGGGTWLAATLIGGGRWQAGETLMQGANPEQWERMARLYKACPQDSSTELCEATLAVRTIPPGTPAGPERPRTPSRLDRTRPN